MKNLLSLTEFCRALKEKPLGFDAVYIVPDGKEYKTTATSLSAIAHREGFNISFSQVYLVDPQTMTTRHAVKVIRK